MLMWIARSIAIAEEPEPAFVEACPHAVEVTQAIKERTHSRRPKIIRVSHPKWRQELLAMQERDQAARNQWIAEGRPANEAALEAVDRTNLHRVKRMLAKNGFPTAAMVGYDGVAALWLLLQHADKDPKHQRRWLAVMQTRADADELSREQLAMFTDRVLLANGQKQRYGSQAEEDDGGLKVRPVEDPAHLNARRAAMDMIPEEDYLCVLRSMYSKK